MEAEIGKKKSLLGEALELAYEKYNGLKDKAGKDYYLHPQRVQECFWYWSKYDDIVTQERCEVVAILHDVLEDTDVTEEYLRQEFGDIITDAIISVTRQDGESYMDFVKRACENPIGILVKLFDIQDNLNIMRLVESDYKFTDTDWSRIQKYIKAYRYIRKKLEKDEI